jgi:hypothetical protein
MKRMIVDTANVLFRVAAAHGKYGPAGTPEEKAGLAMHIALNTLNKYYKKYRPDQLVVTFEGGQNWRKEYTKSAQCKSKKLYKGNRVKDASMEPFFELIKGFEDLARTHTAVACLSAPRLEGDDLFAGFVERYGVEDESLLEGADEIIGISGDRDFVQLLKYKNFTLIDPNDGKPRTCDDPHFFMFEKCFRGDPGDNVMTAYPRVLKTKLAKAMTDDYMLTQLLNHEWDFTDPETGEVTHYKTCELFEENKLLMDLHAQPEDIRQLVKETLDYELEHHGKFSHFHFTKFCGKFGLAQIAENAQTFADMFSANGKKVMSPNGVVSNQLAKKKPSLLTF